MDIIQPKHNLMLILLSKMTGTESPEEIYNRTRFAWKTNIKRASNVDYVIAHNSDEEILEIYKPREWLLGDDKEFESLGRGKLPDRIGFIGDIAEDDIQEMYSGCSTPPRKKGAANPIRYLEQKTEEDDYDDVDLDDLLDDIADNEESGKMHTYLAGVYTEDDSIDEILNTVYEFVDVTFYKFPRKLPIYLIASSEGEDDINFLKNISDLKLIKLFEGNYYEDDEEPSKDRLKEILDSNADSKIFDGGYSYIWFLFQFPEEDENDFEEPGSHWDDVFYQLVKDFPAIALVGYHSGIEDNIWQQWGDGEFDEGAISNPDEEDFYKGDNLLTNHKIDLDCLDISNFEKK